MKVDLISAKYLNFFGYYTNYSSLYDISNFPIGQAVHDDISWIYIEIR